MIAALLWSLVFWAALLDGVLLLGPGALIVVAVFVLVAIAFRDFV